MSYRLLVWILCALFLLTQGFYLHRVPALMGDEASEGENVYELLQADQLVITGERSYIGPLIDYVRVPFVWALGYTTLAVRIPILLFSLATFWLALFCLRAAFGDTAALYGLVALVFSPVFIAHQRLGWAISLFPFFLCLTWALVIRFYRKPAYSQLPLLIGLVAGIGLANHVLFLPSLVALVVACTLAAVRTPKKLLLAWPAVIGFWAGFGVQFAVMLLMKDDQGEPATNATLFWERVHDLPTAWPLFVSGSSYIAHYTGSELSGSLSLTITVVLMVLALLSWLSVRRNSSVIWLWVWAVVYWPVLFLMIDRFSLRYFVMGCLWLWLMAGVGLHELLRLLRFPERWRAWLPIGVGVLLSVWAVFSLFTPYLLKGGSTDSFSLGNRTDSAAALVDINPLLACLRQQGSVFSENVHIYNRLVYLSHSDELLHVVSEEDKKQAQLLVSYRLPADEGASRTEEVCPDLVHFRVIPQSDLSL